MNTKTTDNKKGPVLFIPHGGGPRPLLDDPTHQQLVEFLQRAPSLFPTPDAIVVISAHWEENKVAITSGESPSLIYDYYGFPEESYHIQYSAPGAPQLAHSIHQTLQQKGIPSTLVEQRGFDHGMFVPLKLMYPQAQIPCIQISLLHNLNAQAHIVIGQALSALRDQNILFLGSGFSFHNMKAFYSSSPGERDDANVAFEYWLNDTCTSSDLSDLQRLQRLADWVSAPGARYCHPREEHLLPLQVCAGLGGSAATRVFNDQVLGKQASAYLWMD